MIIMFHTNQLSLRGTEVALYDYAHYNEALLGNKSIVIYDNKSENSESAISKFSSRFQTIGYNDFSEVEHLIRDAGADVLYQIKYGLNDGRKINGLKNINHAVFPVGPDQAHGDVFAFVSNWLSLTCSDGKLPFVPHMIGLNYMPGDYRSELGLSRQCFVFGYYGGKDSFNIDFVKQEISDALKIRRDISFVFMNVDNFIDHDRIIFLPGSANHIAKNKFINTCDAMIHARDIGESFGLAVAEFSSRNKPVITFDRSPQSAHLELLGSRAVTYSNAEDIRHILLHIDQYDVRNKNWDAVGEKFSPSAVMEKFKTVFLT